MSESELKAEVARLRAENEKLAAVAQSAVRVDKRVGKDGKTWISVKGIPGTGWGISAQPQGWAAFLSQMPVISTQVKALL